MTGKTAIVVGGGIAGLATAAGLNQRGWTVTLLEQAAEFGAVGAAIALWPNALRALDEVGALDKLGGERVAAAGGVRDWHGRWIVRQQDPRDALAEVAVPHRAELMDALLSQVPADIRVTGVRVREVRIDGRHAVVRHDGGELTADLVVGADGLRSVVRTSLWPNPPALAYSGQTVWRVVLPRPATLSAAEVSWTETWGPGGVFGVFPMPGDRLYCYGTASVPAWGQSPDGELAEFRRRFADWCHPIPAILAAAEPEQVLRNDLFYLPKLSTFTQGPVALVGDAAHAMVPYLDQGGCQGLEDAATLVVLADSEPDLAAALRRYDRLRRPRSQRVWSMSRATGRGTHVRSAALRALRDAVLRALPPSIALSSTSSLFDWRPPAA